MTYAEKLKDPRWQKKRLKRLESSGFSCDNCGGGEEELHVHHKKYVKGKQPWQYENKELTVLCKTCHDELHISLESLQSAIGEVVTAGIIERIAGYVAALNGHDILVSDYDGPDYIAGIADYFRTTPFSIRAIEKDANESNGKLEFPISIIRQAL